jgi:hypothetical protein
VLATGAATAAANGQVSTQGQALAALAREFPGVRTHRFGERVRALFGVPMTRGEDARAAAQSWLKAYGPAFSGSGSELDEYSHVRLTSGKTVTRYRQRLHGVPVDGSSVTVVTQRLGQDAVVYAAARLADGLPGPWPAPAVSPGQALAVARRHEAGSGLAAWSDPELRVIYEEDGKGAAPAVLCWRIVGENPDAFASWTFWVGAYNGAVVRCASNVSSFDITGTVRGYATPASKGNFGPDTWGWEPLSVAGTLECPNPPTDHVPIPFCLVEAVDGGSQVAAWAMADPTTGAYVLDVPNSQTFTVRAKLIGPYWRVWHIPSSSPSSTIPANPEVYGSSVVSPASGIDIDFNHESNPPPTPPPGETEEFRTAHVNAYLALARTWGHVYARVNADNYIPGLHDMITIHTNSIFLFGGGNSNPIQYYLLFGRRYATYPPRKESGVLRNAAYSVVLAHEYGHYLLYHVTGVSNTASEHEAFHEGYSDSLAHLVYDTDIVGQDYYGCDEHEREPLNPRREYPWCDEARAHKRGMILSGIWLDILGNLSDTCGGCSCCDGLELARQLHVDWTFITQGGESSLAACSSVSPGHAAHVGTLIEVLTADDDDGDLSNGTPHLAEICAAFDLHGINEVSFCGSGRPGRGGAREGGVRRLRRGRTGDDRGP